MNKSNKLRPRKRARKPQSRNARRGSGRSSGAAGRTQSQASTGKRKPPAGAGGKLASLVTMLRRPKGASIDDLCKATGWQAHSVRGAISGSVKKRLGLAVTSDRIDGVRVYRATN